jgi:DNA-binding MarR family transcriptional regulator
MNLKREDYPLVLMLMMLNESFRERLYEGYAAAGFDDIRPAHQVVFDLLSHEGERVVDLAKRADTTKQAMGYLVAYLEERGYLERVPDPKDGRAQIVRRTVRGWDVTRLARHLIIKIQQDWAEKFGVERMEQVILLMRELVKSVGAEGVIPK